GYVEQGEQVLGGLAEVEVGGEREAQGDLAGGRGDGFLAVAAERGEDGGDELGAVLRDDREGVAGLVGQAAAIEGKLDVVDLLGRAGRVEVAHGEEGSGRRVFLRITRFMGDGRWLMGDGRSGARAEGGEGLVEPGGEGGFV